MGRRDVTAPLRAIQPSDLKVFLESLAQTGIVTSAATKAGFDRVSFYRLRNEVDDDGEYVRPELREAWDAALDEATDGLRTEARRRAVEGVDEPVFYQGEVCGVIRKYSDALLARLLQAHCPEHRDVRAIDLRTPPGESVKLEVDDAPERAVRIAQLLAELEPPEIEDADDDAE